MKSNKEPVLSELLTSALKMAQGVGCEVVRSQTNDLEGETKTMFAGQEVCFAPRNDLRDLKMQALQVLILEGAFLVAENGACWINGDAFGDNRALPFLAETLVVILNPTQIAGNMHEAYERIGSERFAYGLFMSGPSKTADIEQSLVIGAQGPRRLVLWLKE